MALDQSALSELLDALRAGGDLDVVREALALVLQALIEAEAAQQIGAGRYERSATRTTHRNGSRTRVGCQKSMVLVTSGSGRPCEGLRCAVVPCLPLLGCLWSGRSFTWRCATSSS